MTAAAAIPAATADSAAVSAANTRADSSSAND
jgi:hypothetical protein